VPEENSPSMIKLGHSLEFEAEFRELQAGSNRNCRQRFASP